MWTDDNFIDSYYIIRKKYTFQLYDKGGLFDSIMEPFSGEGGGGMGGWGCGGGWVGVGGCGCGCGGFGWNMVACPFPDTNCPVLDVDRNYWVQGWF